ncbi:hypothetical protein C0431_06950 [bacterium]|nr:hypothetical protein [bacterium]
MIFDFFINLLANMISALIALLPPMDVSSTILNEPSVGNSTFHPVTGAAVQSNPMFYLLSMAASLNAFVPVDQALIMMGLIAFVYGIMITYKIIRVVIGTLRGAGTS